MVPNSIPIPLPGGMSFELSRFVKLRQKFDPAHVADIDAEIAREFKRFSGTDLKGKSVAIGAGSRGIKPQPAVVRAVIRELKAAGANPFLVPTMGSHGGGVVQGQVDILEGYGLGEKETGVPIRASMDVVEVGRLADGTPIYCDRIAFEADYIVPCNRIKPHTDYRGPHESGLVKMIAIGMAKHKGAETLHRHGFARFHEIIPAAAKVFLENTRVLFGIAMVENAYDDLRHVELVPAGEIFARDTALLAMAKANIPTLLMPKVDVLFINQIGKNISGAGMDPNVTGRPGTRLPGFDIETDIHRIIVSDLTDVTHGNACGIAMADVTTQRLAQKTDWSMTYVNIVTSGEVHGGAMPLVADTDEIAMAVALRGCPNLQPVDAKIVRIANTLELSEIWVSEPVLGDLEGNDNVEVMSRPFDAAFDSNGTWPLWT